MAAHPVLPSQAELFARFKRFDLYSSLSITGVLGPGCDAPADVLRRHFVEKYGLQLYKARLEPSQRPDRTVKDSCKQSTSPWYT